MKVYHSFGLNLFVCFS